MTKKEHFFHLSLLPVAKKDEHITYILFQIKAILKQEGMPDAELNALEFKPSRNLFILNKEEITKEALLEFTNTFNYTSLNQYSRFFVLFSVDLLNTAQASSLLKFLEEPKTSTYGFLVPENPDAVLDTIKSRAFPVTYENKENTDKPVSLDEEIFELSGELFKDEIEVFENRVFLDSLQTPFLDFISVILDPEKKYTLTLAKYFSVEHERISGRVFLKLIQTFLMDAINFKLKRSLHFKSQEEHIAKLASFQMNKLIKTFDFVQKRTKAFYFPVNARMQILTALIAFDQFLK